jgi:hypothetical protein
MKKMKITERQIGMIAVVLTLTILKYVSKEAKMKIALILAIVSFALIIIYVVKYKSKFHIKMYSIIFLISSVVFSNYYNDMYIFNKYYSGISVLIVISLLLLFIKVLLDNVRDQGDIQKYRKTKIAFIVVTLIYSIFAIIILVGMFK